MQTGRPLTLDFSRRVLLYAALALGAAFLLVLMLARVVSAAGEGISLSVSTLDAKDSDKMVEYTVALTGEPAPDSNVTVAIASDNDAVGIDVDPDMDGAQAGPLTFTMANYKTAQTVMLLVKDDNLVSEGANITHTSSGPGDYNDKTAMLRIEVTDDDVAGVTVESEAEGDEFDPSTTPIKVTETDDVVTASYTVVLSNQPIGEVTVEIKSNNSDVTVDPATLTFTSEDWETAKPVSVTVAADASTDDESATLTHDVKSDVDTDFNAVADSMVMVAITDDDDPGATITAGTDPTMRMLAINEGTQTATYTVVLTAAPTDNVTVTISSENGDVTAYGPTLPSTNVLTFTEANYEDAQTVTIDVATDGDLDDEKAKLSHAFTSADPNFTNAAIIKAAGDAAVAGLDDAATDEAKKMARDEAEKDAKAGFEVSLDITDTTKGVKLGGEGLMENALKIDEEDGPATGSYTVVLRAEPSGPVTVKITISGSDDATLENPRQ